VDGSARFEHPGDDPEDGRWLSYDELGQIRGISRESAIRLARREKWPRTRGNDGTARVFCPGDWLKSSRKNPEDQSPGQHATHAPNPGGAREDLSNAIKAFESGLVAFREQMEAERQRSNWAELARDAARTELSAEKEVRAGAEQDRARAEERANRAEAELAGAQEALAGAEQRLREAEATRAEFWSRSRFARIRAVWRGRG
jgi:hypothetical protein